MKKTRDERIANICLASIRRSSMDHQEWEYTKIGLLNGELVDLVKLKEVEIVLVSSFISEKSWYVMTTRRIICNHDGRVSEIDAQGINEHDFANFKGRDNRKIELAKISAENGQEVKFEFETGKASMAPIYCLMTLPRKIRSINRENQGN